MAEPILVERLRAQATFVPESRPGDVMLEAAVAVEAILALHFEYVSVDDGGYCNECGKGWFPCPTARACGVST